MCAAVSVVSVGSISAWDGAATYVDRCLTVALRLTTKVEKAKHEASILRAIITALTANPCFIHLVESEARDAIADHDNSDHEQNQPHDRRIVLYQPFP
jgi:hypothetical protein